jgi:inositol transport system substrate-binding protein
MSQFDDTYLTNVREYMDKHAKSYPKGDGVQLQFEDARADVVKQLSQVENFISQKVDAIIVNPVDTASTARISKSAIEAGIPLVYVNRRPDQKDLPKGVAAVTSDDEEAGRLQMQYIADGSAARADRDPAGRPGEQLHHQPHQGHQGSPRQIPGHQDRAGTDRHLAARPRPWSTTG